jgi:DNA-binding transcriptional regulator YhcF (GntR family)
MIKSRITPGDIGSVITIRRIQGLAGTTYPTARRTAEHLESEGVLQPHQGKGYEVIATPEGAAAQRAGMKELGAQLAQMQNQMRDLAARLEVPADLRETLERIEFNLEALYRNLGIPYPGDGGSEQQESEPAAR